MTYFVCRQNYWPDGLLRVEISKGVDQAGPNMYSPFYKGEGEYYKDPRDAALAAMDICRLWRLAIRRRGGKSIEWRPEICIGYRPSGDEYSFADIRQWAKDEYDKLPKCPKCGDIVGKEKWTHQLSDDPFCSQNCADNDYADQQVQDGAELDPVDTYTDEV